MAQRAIIRIEHSCRFLLQSKCPHCSRLDCGGMLEYMVVRATLGYDWFVWIPSIYVILLYLFPMYSYIYRPPEAQYSGPIFAVSSLPILSNNMHLRGSE
uniref:Uncharacterized protein n=1 Tax=Oryza nivara TaxID=4536 RepID=A0A0E0IHR7_ORYNI